MFGGLIFHVFCSFLLMYSVKLTHLWQKSKQYAMAEQCK